MPSSLGSHGRFVGGLSVQSSDKQVRRLEASTKSEEKRGSTRIEQCCLQVRLKS